MEDFYHHLKKYTPSSDQISHNPQVVGDTTEHCFHWCFFGKVSNLAVMLLTLYEDNDNFE